MVNRTKLAANIPLFYVYYFLNSFILDRAIWMLFLVSQGFSLSEIALIESAYHCTIFLLEVPTGYVADRYGKRASLLVAELVGIVSSGLLLTGGHWSIVVAGFMLGGLVGTFRSGATSALIYETLVQLGKEDRFKRYNSQLSAVMLLTLGISGTAGGLLSDIDWAWVYAGKMIVSALTFAAVYVLTEPPASDDETGEGNSTYSFFRQLKLAYEFGRTNLSFASLCLYGAVLYSMSWSVSFYSQVIFQNVGLSNRWIGLVNGLETWLSAAIAAVAFVGERWLGQRGTIAAVGLGFIISLVLFSVSGDAKSAVTCFFLMALVISYLEPLMDAYLNELLPSPIRATMLSVFSMMISVGMMITFSVIGFLADRTNVSAALQYVLIVWVPVCVLCIGWAVKRTGKRSGSE